MPLAAVTLALALAAPNGLPVLHSPQAEQSMQAALFDRLRDADTPSGAPRRQLRPPPMDSGHDAAWRADHLTCVSRKGRTPDQYQRECGPWLAEEAARGAAH